MIVDMLQEWIYFLKIAAFAKIPVRHFVFRRQSLQFKKKDLGGIPRIALSFLFWQGFSLLLTDYCNK